MSSQRIVRVGTPATGRKRNRSAPSPTNSSIIKKARNSKASPIPSVTDENKSPTKESSSRRALYKDAPTPAPRRKIFRENADSGPSSEAAMERLIDRLSVDISNKFSELNERIDRLEQGLEQRISTKVAQLLDKRINSELKKLRKDVDAHIETVTDTIKAEIASDIKDINTRMASVNSNSTPDISCNIVVRNLQETHNENVTEKVNTLIREGCGVREISVRSAERKSGSNGKPGVVIATFNTLPDKKAVMQNKRKLKSSKRFQNVYIQHDQTKADRLMTDNFRTLLTALKMGDQTMTLRGARVVRGNDRPDTHTTNNTRRPDNNGNSRHNGGRQNRHNGNTNRDSQHHRRY